MGRRQSSNFAACGYQGRTYVHILKYITPESMLLVLDDIWTDGYYD